MLDLAKSLIFVILSGYLSLSVFRYRQNRKFTKLTGERYLTAILAYGAISLFNYHLIRSLLLSFNFEPKILGHFLIVAKFIFFVSNGVFWGYLTGRNSFLKCLRENNEKIRENKLPYTTGFMEKEFVNTFDEDDPQYKIYFIELRNRKVYVGIVVKADIEDNMPTEEKILSLIPMKSGYRKEADGKVHYDTFYLEDELIANFLDSKEFDDKVVDEISNLDAISIFQREMISYRKYNHKLNIKFTQ